MKIHQTTGSITQLNQWKFVSRLLRQRDETLTSWKRSARGWRARKSRREPFWYHGEMRLADWTIPLCVSRRYPRNGSTLGWFNILHTRHSRTRRCVERKSDLPQRLELGGAYLMYNTRMWFRVQRFNSYLQRQCLIQLVGKLCLYDRCCVAPFSLRTFRRSGSGSVSIRLSRPLRTLRIRYRCVQAVWLGQWDWGSYLSRLPIPVE